MHYGILNFIEILFALFFLDIFSWLFPDLSGWLATYFFSCTGFSRYKKPSRPFWVYISIFTQPIWFILVFLFFNFHCNICNVTNPIIDVSKVNNGRHYQWQTNGTLVLIAGFRAGIAGLNLDYPENPALKPRKPS